MAPSSSSRVLLAHLLVALLVAALAQAASLELDLCSPQSVEEFLARTSSEDDIELAYEHCRANFLDGNAIGPAVKATVDQWVGTDLSKAETNQIFLAYELALVGPRPAELAPEFEGQCRGMVAAYQAYRDAVEPLAARVDIDLDSLLAEGDEEVDEQERGLLNFVQYAQFCKSLLNESRKDGERRDETAAE